MSKATKQKSLISHDSSFDAGSYTNGNIFPYYQTDLGTLFEGDCLDILPTIKAGIVDTVFADPPFSPIVHFTKRGKHTICTIGRTFIDFIKQGRCTDGSQFCHMVKCS